MVSARKIVLAFPISLMAYILACFGGVLLEYVLASTYKAKTFLEHGPVENLQMVLLLVSAVLFLVKSLRDQKIRRVSLFLSGMCFGAVFRELDSFMDEHIVCMGWKIGFLFVAVPAVYCLKNRRGLLQEVVILVNRRVLVILLFCAFIVIFPIAQCLGHKPFVSDVLENAHVGKIKELIEESIETIGYLLILCSSIEINRSHRG